MRISSVTGLPFNELVGLQQGGDSSLLTLPAGEQYLNHLGTVHAGALLTLAEAASGEFLLRHFGPVEGVIPVVRRIEAKFRKPAHGAITSTVSAPEAALDEMNRGLSEKGRALLSIPVDLHDQSGTHVLSASVEWFITTQR
jgi:acyl-coenzyme A thioesterase PaaI-like protein